MDVARSAAREVLRQHNPEVERQEPLKESIDAVAARELMDVSLSALRLGAQEVHLACWVTGKKANAAPATTTHYICLRDSSSE
jgi:hypothetical protein